MRANGQERPRTFVTVHCPPWDSEPIVKRGTTRRGTQRYLCQHTTGLTGRLLRASRTRGCLPEVKQPIIALRLKASGVRETARSLHLRPTTVVSALKKKAGRLETVHPALLRPLHPEQGAGEMAPAGAAEMEERGSFVGNKGNPRWLWPARDQQPGAGLA